MDRRLFNDVFYLEEHFKLFYDHKTSLKPYIGQKRCSKKYRAFICFLWVGRTQKIFVGQKSFCICFIGRKASRNQGLLLTEELLGLEDLSKTFCGQESF